MSEPRIERALDIFREACDLPADERAALVDRACAGDAELRAQVESMLAWDTEESAENIPSHGVRPALDGIVDEARTEPLPESIDGYRVVRLIAHGGMGIVYEGIQDHPKRRVAIKLARPGGTSAEFAKRFTLEAQLLARLNHPGIARIIEAGTTPTRAGARSFIVMEYVEGKPLTAHAATRSQSTRDKLELIIRVANPVAFAHDKGVVHRDLKPDNVLIGDDGVPKVLDFGVAKVEAAGGFGAATMRTEAGRVIGTIGYMAPEQLGGASEAVTASADVYSLGVLTYELLTGRLPHDLEGVTLSRALAVVTATDAPPLSVVRPEFRGDVEAVVAKALEKEPRDRYPDASAFLADVERCLRNEPVLARRHSRLHRLRKFTRRNRGLVGGLAATGIALLLGLVVALVLAASEAEQRELFDRLAAVVQHERLATTVDGLDPAWPDQVGALQAWLSDCEELLGQREDLRRTLTKLHDSPGDRFLRTSIKRLLPELERLDTRVLPTVRRRFAWARVLRELTKDHPKARVTWDEARARIAASSKYADQPPELRDDDVLGLVPIGENPVSGLWEFYHLRSAWDGETDPRTLEIPEHASVGRIQVKEGSGIVFVLVPGGTFWMGEQKKDPGSPNFVAGARRYEGRRGLAHRVTLAPYLIAKHELTQGQWARLSDGDRPSAFHTGNPGIPGWPKPEGDDRHPVEQVDWNGCRALLRRHALTIPTEAQWEHACRAGTGDPWYTGKSPATLAGHANLMDETAVRMHPTQNKGVPFDDGFFGTAPVGRYAPNAFGLYDMHGNVAEWVREQLPCPYELEPRVGDGFRATLAGDAPKGGGITRGGSLMDLAGKARSGFRRDAAPGMTLFAVGIRAARELRPTAAR